MNETLLRMYLADLQVGPKVPLPAGESWPRMVERISAPGAVAAVDEDTFGYFLNVLPPRWLGRGGFAFGEGANPLRLFWTAGKGEFRCRQLDTREHRAFCRLAGIGLSSG